MRQKSIAALLLAASFPAVAATTTSQFNVTVTTVSASAVISVSGNLAFGNVADTATANAQTGFTVTATSTLPYSISLDGGANYNAGTQQSFMKDGGGLNAREYMLYQDIGHTTVWGPAGSNLTGLTGDGTAQPYTIYGVLLATAGTSGAISDIVTITVTY